MVQNTLPPETSQQDAMLLQAIVFIGEGKYAKAKELLTGLLQTDQNNATYWVWLSAAMDTQKERLYCLQMAYKMDPGNVAAQRGLILLGALNPDDVPQKPFPMNHPRPWEARLRLAEEKDKPKGIKRVTTNPFFRLGAVIFVAVVVLGTAVFGIGSMIYRRAGPVNLTPATPRPTVTPVIKKGPTANATIVPLSDLLVNGTYTPTAVYAMTPHADAALDAYRGALKAYKEQRWAEMGGMMEQIATSQPGSVDAIYFIAEGKRLSGQYEDALEYYKEAIKINPKFAPIYLGQARAKLGINAGRAVTADFDKAIALDPKYAEAYLERGLYSLRKQNVTAARKDIEQAALIAPESVLIQYNLAKLLLTLGENEAALAAAQKAKDLDITSLDTYLLLGKAASANGEIDRAVEVLDLYTKYTQTNAEAYAILGEAYFKRGDNEVALKNIEQAIAIDKNNSEAYRWRGEIYLASGEGEKALADFKQSYRINLTFDGGIGIARSLLMNVDPKADPQKTRDSYNEVFYYINDVEKQLKTDEQRAIFYYYKATVIEKLNDQISATNTWNILLKLPETAMSPEMRAEAKAHIIALQSATAPPPTAKVTLTPKLTPTLSPTPKK